MSISRITQGSAESSSATISGVSPGQRVLVFAFRRATSTVPSVPSDWENHGSAQSNGPGQDCSVRVGSRIVPAGGLTTTGTWANAERIFWVALASDDAEKAVAVGNVTLLGSTANALFYRYGALTLTVGKSGQWLIGAATRTILDTAATAPSGMSTLLELPGAAGTDSLLVSTEGVRSTDWPQTDADAGSLNLSANYASAVVEVYEEEAVVEPPDPEVVGQTGGQSADGSDVVIDLTGLDLQEDDVLIAVGGIGNENAAVPVWPPTGPPVPFPIEESWEQQCKLHSTTDSRPTAAVWGLTVGDVPPTSVTFRGTGSLLIGPVAAAYNILHLRHVTLDTYIRFAPGDDPNEALAAQVTEGMLVIAAVYAPEATWTAPPAGYDNLQAREQAADWPMALATATKISSGSEDPGTFTPSGVLSSRVFTIAVTPTVNTPAAPELGIVVNGSGWMLFSVSDFVAGVLGDTPRDTSETGHVAIEIQIQPQDLWGTYDEEWADDWATVPVRPGRFDNDASWCFVDNLPLGGTGLFVGLRAQPNVEGTEAAGGRWRARACWIGTIGGRGPRSAWVEFETWLADRFPAAPGITLIEESGTLAVVRAGPMSTDAGVTTKAEHFADENPFQIFAGGSVSPANTPYRFLILWDYTRGENPDGFGLFDTRYFLQLDVGEHPDVPPDVAFVLDAGIEYLINARWVTGEMRFRALGAPGSGAHNSSYPLEEQLLAQAAPYTIVPELWDANVSLVMGGRNAVNLEVHPQEPILDCETIEENFEQGCDGHSLNIALAEVECGATQAVWWRYGRVSNGNWDGSETFIDQSGGLAMMVRSFPVLDPGITVGVGWARKIGGVWYFDTFNTPQVTCVTPDAVPLPFFINPPGHPYLTDFTLQWDVERGPSAVFASSYTYRVRHRPLDATEDDWTEIAAAQTEQEIATDWLDALELGAYHLIGVTAIAANRESPEAQFIFRKADPTLYHIRDFKADSALPADGVEMWDPATMIFDHVTNLGVAGRKASLFPIVFQPGVMALGSIGATELGSRGVLCFGDRLRVEGSGYNKFDALAFNKWGVALLVSGTGTNKAAWAGLLLRVEHGLPWGFGSNPRTPGNSGGIAGVHMEFNRVVNAASPKPFGYARAVGFTVKVVCKRLGTSLFEDTFPGSTQTLATLYFPTNSLHGLRAYSLAWELERITGEVWALRFMVLGPDCEPRWAASIAVPEWRMQNGTLRQLPAGALGLVAENPYPNGDALYHSLVVEPLTALPEPCVSGKIAVRVLGRDIINPSLHRLRYAVVGTLPCPPEEA